MKADPERRQEAAISPSLTWCCRRLWVCQSITTTGGRTHWPALCLSHALTLMTLLCVCPQMANLVTSLCCVVLAAVVVAYAQRRSQLGEYAILSSSSSLDFTSSPPRPALLRLTSRLDAVLFSSSQLSCTFLNLSQLCPTPLK